MHTHQLDLILVSFFNDLKRKMGRGTVKTYNLDPFKCGEGSA